MNFRHCTTLKQSVVAAGKLYVVVIDMERTAGTLTVAVGGTNTNFTSTGTHVISVTSAGTNSDFVISAGTTFAGKIKSVSLKGVTVIAYNFMNLPEIVTRAGDKQLRYIYDASGRKLRQEVTNNTVLEKATDYAGEYIYENDTLQFINHEEGRIIPRATPEYQYNLKDHLGNVRMTFTSKHEADTTVATLETASVSEEEGEFLYYDEAVKINSTVFDHTNSGATNYALRLTGAQNNQFGLAKSLSVMPGDTVRATVYAKYLEQDSTEWNPGGFASFMNTIRWGTPAGGVLIDGGLSGSTGGVTPPFGALLTKGEGNEDGAPKAYLNYLVFDRDYNLKDGGFITVTEDAREYGQNGSHEELFKQIIINEAGYVYLYLSNDNAALGGSLTEVYFDDFTVEHVKSPVVQQDDYYAFGLTFNSLARENGVDNQYLFNGKEKQNELDLGWMDYGARMYMPEICRFGTQDVYAHKLYSWSPYAYSLNNPICYTDNQGKMPLPVIYLVYEGLVYAFSAGTAMYIVSTTDIQAPTLIFGGSAMLEARSKARDPYWARFVWKDWSANPLNLGQPMGNEMEPRPNPGKVPKLLMAAAGFLALELLSEYQNWMSMIKQQKRSSRKANIAINEEINAIYEQLDKYNMDNEADREEIESLVKKKKFLEQLRNEHEAYEEALNQLEDALIEAKSRNMHRQDGVRTSDQYYSPEFLEWYYKPSKKKNNSIGKEDDNR